MKDNNEEMNEQDRKEFEQLKGRVQELSLKREEIFFLSQKFEMEYEEDRKTLGEIHTALIGNQLGQPGLVRRVEDIEKYITEDKALKQKVTGGVLVLGAVWTVVWTGILYVINKFL